MQSLDSKVLEYKIACFRGSIDNVLCLNFLPTNDWKRIIKIVYVVNPIFPPVCIKSLVDVPVGNIQEVVKHYWQSLSRKTLGECTLLYRTSKIDGRLRKVNDEMLSSYPNRATFVLDSSLSPVDIENHSGLLWSCQACDHGNTVRTNLMAHFKRCNETEQDQNHTFLWSQNLAPINWGHEKTKKADKFWGEPSDQEKTSPMIVIDGEMSEAETEISCIKKDIRADSPLGVLVTNLNDVNPTVKTGKRKLHSDNNPKGKKLKKCHIESIRSPVLQTRCGVCDAIFDVCDMENHVNATHYITLDEYLYDFGDPACNKTDHIIISQMNTNHVETNSRQSFEEPFEMNDIYMSDKEDNHPMIDNLKVKSHVRKSSRHNSQPRPSYKESYEEEDIFWSDSDDDPHYDPKNDADSKESDEEVCENMGLGICGSDVRKSRNSRLFPRIKKHQPVNPNSFPDSDVEDESYPEKELERAKRQHDRRESMLTSLMTDACINVYKPDTEDEEYERMLLLAPTQMASRKYVNKKMQIPNDVKNQMKKGLNLTGENAKYQVKTYRVRRDAMRRLMGAMQEDYNRLFPDVLPGGLIKYKYFVAFREKHFLRPANVLPLIDKFNVASVKVAMYSSIMVILDEVANFADSNEGWAIFRTPKDGETDWDDSKARQLQKDIFGEIERAKWRMERAKVYGKWKGEIEEKRDLIKKGREEFENFKVPNPKEVVPKYLESSYVVELEKEMLRVAEDKSIPVTYEFLRESQDDVILRLSLKAGNRTECYRNATVGDLAQAQKTGLIDIPFIEDIDPSMNSPVFQQFRESLKGYCLVGEYHKTLNQQAVWLWASQVDMVYLQAVEELGYRYLKENGIERSSESPLFINSIGGQYLHDDGGKGMNFSKFIEITQVPRMTLYVARKMFIDWNWNQRNAVLKECAAFGAAHSLETGQRYYVSDLTKQLMSGTSNSAFRANLDLLEDSVSQEVNYRVQVNEKQDERFLLYNKKRYDQKYELFIEAQTQGISYSVPTIKKMITEKAKNGLVEMIVELEIHQVLITKRGSVADILLTKRAVANTRNQVLLMRMIDLAPKTWPCTKALIENLILVSRLIRENMKQDGDTPTTEGELLRKIEKVWSLKMLRVLSSLGSDRSTKNSNIIKLLHHLAHHSNSMKYTLGSKFLTTQIENWRPWKPQASQLETIKPSQYTELLSKRQKKSQSDLCGEENSSVKQSAIGMSGIQPISDDFGHEEDGSDLSCSYAGSSKMNDVSDSSSIIGKTTFEVENCVVDLPESPLKTRIRIGDSFHDVSAPVKVSTLHEITKNVSRNKFGTIKFNNSMKRSLLKLYVRLASNPLVKTRRDKIQECQKLYSRESIDIDGDLIPLKDVAFKASSLGDLFDRRGKSGDTRGLSYPIFEVKTKFKNYINSLISGYGSTANKRTNSR